MSPPLRFGCGYLRDAFSDPDSLIDNANRVLRDVKFDTMIGTGLSGSLVIPVLARALGKYWAIVRKDHHGSHSASSVEGQIGDRWIFVDDLIDSGATRLRVIQRVKNRIKQHNEYTSATVTVAHVGTYCYADSEYTSVRHYSQSVRTCSERIS